MYEDMARGWKIIAPGSGWASPLFRGAPLAAGWLRESQLISDQPMGQRVSTPWVERYRPERSPFSSAVGARSRDVEGFLNREWDPILPGCGGISKPLWLEYSCSARTNQRPEL